MASTKRKSKKRSTTKTSYRELLKDHVFFVDRSSGRYALVEGLRNLGLNVEAHDDHFNANTIDVEWIGYCGQRNWIVISSDKKIKKNYLERQAILASKVAALFFTSASISSSQQISAFELALRRISNLVAREKRPFIARISPNGAVELWLNHRGEDLVAKKLARRNRSD